jgi:small subunit ribosomal protein S17
MANTRRRLQGRVISNKMDKTVVVEIQMAKQHRLYRKVIRYTETYMAHDESNALQLGDLVQIVESRPLSRHKRWVVEKVLNHTETAALEETQE